MRGSVCGRASAPRIHFASANSPFVLPIFFRAPTNDESRNSGAKKPKGKRQEQHSLPLRDGKKTLFGFFFAPAPATAINAQSEMGGKKVKAKSAFGSLSGARNTEGKTENVHMRKRPSSSHICFEQASNYLKASLSSPCQRPPTRRRRHICAKTDKGSFFCQRR